MSPIFVRQTYWNIPCTQRRLATGIETLKKALNAPGRGTPTAAGPSFSFCGWQEYKIGTYGGHQVLLVVEVAHDAASFSPIESPQLKGLLLHKRRHRFQADRGQKKHAYLLFGYTPFRSQDYNTYRKMRALEEKNAILQNHLTFHLSELSARLAWPMKAPLQVNAMKIRREKQERLGGCLHTSFDLAFTSNLFVPEFLGLGRGATLGLGVVRPVRANGSRKTF